MSRFASKMKAKGVKVLDEKSSIGLECEKCGAKWSPNIQPGGRLPRRYWQCPNGCNVEDRVSG